MTTRRLSPVHGRLEALGARFAELDGMLVAGQIGNGDAARARVLGLADLSHLQKTGFKGGDAAAGVRGQGLVLPEPNSWAEVDGGGMLARLARSEFFIEDEIGGLLVARVRTMLRQMPAGIYPVMRQDAGFALTGERANELLVETCNVNFGELAAESRNVVMTSMVGVSVLVVRRDNGQRPCYRLWCDPTMAPYLWDTLAGIALELGGGPVGSDVLAASPQA
jgi:sarcosine oxidase subunit gamma